MFRRLLTSDGPSAQTRVIAERYKTHSRTQIRGESASESMAEFLNYFSEYCQFGVFLKEALRDFFGLRHKQIQLKLKTEADLTVETALDIGLGMEAAEEAE